MDGWGGEKGRKEGSISCGASVAGTVYGEEDIVYMI